jgi:hypothetical protein
MSQQQRIMTRKDEWYTPSYILEHCKQAANIKQFAYDLASCESANQRVNALNYFSLENNFFNRNKNYIIKDFWCNPPFTLTTEFVDEIIEGYNNLTIDKGFLLVNANTETKWFQKLAEQSFYCLFLNKRIQFIDGETKKVVKGNPKGQAIFYIGETGLDLEKFSELGRIAYFLSI